jgi:hypothetical protein
MPKETTDVADNFNALYVGHHRLYGDGKPIRSPDMKKLSNLISFCTHR